jgi:hypothetical protein
MTQQEASLLSQLAKTYVGQNTSINPADFPQTRDTAWICIAARHLRAVAGRDRERRRRESDK